MANHLPDFRQSADTKVIAQMLREIEPDGFIEYEKLSRAIGRNVCKEARGILQGARRQVLREDRMVFDVVRAEGLRRLLDPAIVDLSAKARDHIRRTSKRTARKLTCVDYDKLSRADQVKQNAALSMFGVLASIASDTGQRRLERGVSESQEKATLPALRAALAALGNVS